MNEKQIPIPAKLLKELDDGRCVFFIGSGVSDGEGVPSTVGLAEHLISVIKKYQKDEKIIKEAISYKVDLAKIATLYNEIFGSFSAEKSVCDLIKAKQKDSPAIFHKKLNEIPSIEYVLTTNYDTLIEDSFPRESVVTIRRESEFRNARQRWTNIYKVHGCVSFPEEILLDRKSFSVFSTRRQEFAELIKTLFRQFCFICIGYSGEDENFRSLIREVVDKSGKQGSHYFVLPGDAITPKMEFADCGFEHIRASANEFINSIVKEYQSRNYSPEAVRLPAPQSLSGKTGLQTFNPFEMYDTEALAESDATNFVRYFIEPIDFNNVLDKHNVIVEGHRGSGKSMLLRYLSLYHEHARTNALPFWGFYVKLESGFFDAYERTTNSDSEWIKIFQHYFNLVVATALIKNILAAIEHNVWSIDLKEENEVIKRIRTTLLHISQGNYKNTLHELCDEMYDQLDTLRDNPEYKCFKTPPRFIENFLVELSKAVPNINEKWWAVFLDEWDNLSIEQQKAVVMRLHDRSGKLRYKVAVKSLGFIDFSYNDRKLDPTHDYIYICLDHHLFDDIRKANYFRFLELVSKKRLEISGANILDVKELLPKNSALPKLGYDYSGFESFAMLSGGLIREFLELVKDAIYCAFPKIASEKIVLEPIPPKWQQHVARTHSAIHYNNHRGCADSDHIKKLLHVLGTIFRIIDRATSDQKEYRKPLSFVITDVHNITERSKAIILQSIKNRLFQVPIIPKQPRNPYEGIAEKHTLHRMLCPVFSLSLYERYDIRIKSTSLDKIIEYPQVIIKELTKSYGKKKIDKCLQTDINSQLLLFDSEEL